MLTFRGSRPCPCPRRTAPGQAPVLGPRGLQTEEGQTNTVLLVVGPQ